MKKIIDQILIKHNLILSSLFILSYEILKDVIIEKVKSTICLNSHFNKDGELEIDLNEEYHQQITNRVIPKIKKDKNPEYHRLYASSLWLKENNIIDEDDINVLHEIHTQRVFITHKTINFLFDDQININIDLFWRLRELLLKIENRSFVELEPGYPPKVSVKMINDGEIKHGTVILIDYLFEIAKNEMNNI